MFANPNLGKFLRSVLILFSGTSVAQLVPILVSPLLTRLYSPSDFGIYGQLMAIILLSSIVATFRFEHAFFTIKLEKHREILLKFILLNIVLVSLFELSLVFLYLWFGFELVPINEPLLVILIPAGTLVVGCYMALRAWLVRKGEYRHIRRNLVQQSLAYTSFQIMFGVIFSLKSSGLILGDVIGKTATTVSIAWRVDFRKDVICLKRYLVFWRKYSDIPKYQMPASFLSTAAVYLPMVVLPLIFSARESGIFFLVFRVLTAPSSVVGNAFLDVFKRDAALAIRDNGDCKDVFIRNFIALVVISVVVFLPLSLFSSDLFAFAFGETWREAGYVAQIICLLAGARFVSSPLSYIIILREKYRINLIFQSAMLCIVMFSLWLGSMLEFNDFIRLYSSLVFVLYLILLSISFRLVSGE